MNTGLFNSVPIIITRCGSLTRVTFLFFLMLFPVISVAQVGDPVAGQQVFLDRNCDDCHDSSNNAHLHGASLKLVLIINDNPNAHLGGVQPWQPKFNITELRNLAAFLSGIDTNTYQVSGNVFVQGNPSTKIPGVDIDISSTYLAVPNISYVTNGDGDYTIMGIAAGDYTVKAQSGDYQFAPPSSQIELTTLGVKKAGEAAASGTSLGNVDFAGQATGPGQAIYSQNCASSSCHTITPAGNVNNILNGARLSVLQNEADQDNHAGQTPFSTLKFQLSNMKILAAYLSSQDDGTYSISGSLLDTANGLSPINDNNIEIKITSSYLPGVTVKPAAGAYQVTGLQPGDYNVSASHVAYDLQPDTARAGLNAEGVQSNIFNPATLTLNTTELTGIDFQGQMQEPFASGKQIYDIHCIACHDNPSDIYEQGNPNNPPTILGIYNAALYGSAIFTLFPDPSFSPEMNDVMGMLNDDDRNKLAAYLSIMYPVQFELNGRVDFTSSMASPENPGVIPKATILIESTIFPEVRSTTTDEKGRYKVTGLWGGPKTVTVSRGGYTFSTDSKDILAMPFSIQVDKFPDFVLQDQGFTGELDVDISAGESIYANRCSECHGDDPANDENNILLGARLSVIRTIYFHSIPSPQLDPPPLEEDDTAPPYGTSHAAPINVFALDSNEQRAVAAYIASRDFRKYRISGRVWPGFGVPEVNDLTISLFSETVEGSAVITDAQGNYEAGGLGPGDYLVTVPDVATVPGWYKVFTTDNVLGIRNFISIPVQEFMPLLLPDVDFSRTNKLFSMDKFKDILDLVTESESDSNRWQPFLCPERQAVPFDFDRGRFLESLSTDARNLVDHEINLKISGPPRLNSDGTGHLLSVIWERTATVSQSGESVRNRGESTIRLTDNPEREGLGFCGQEGDPLLALSNSDGRLNISSGTINGINVTGDTVVENGRLILLNGERLVQGRSGRGNMTLRTLFFIGLVILIVFTVLIYFRKP